MQTLIASYRTFEDARNVAARLQQAGIDESDISLVGRQSAGDAGAAQGLAMGSFAGAGSGLLLGLGAMTIPGVGPIIGMGWLFTGLAAGAAAGGAIGAFSDAASPEEATDSLIGVTFAPADSQRVTQLLEAALPLWIREASPHERSERLDMQP